MKLERTEREREIYDIAEIETNRDIVSVEDEFGSEKISNWFVREFC